MIDKASVVSERLGYDSLIADKLSPSIELATPVDGGAITGSSFTWLPLPIKTSFPDDLQGKNRAFTFFRRRQAASDACLKGLSTSVKRTRL